MAVPGLDAARCAERNLYAASAGFNAAPVSFNLMPPPPPDGHRVVTASSMLPTGRAAMDRINEGVTGPPLAESDVYLLYPEVGSTRFISSHWMFLARSTLDNTMKACDAGVALMNSHRTGGMSVPAELPYGYTFAARKETMADASGAKLTRVLAGVYMVKGQQPNGAMGPTTDQIYESVRTGMLRDVSLGFAAGGTAVCDVCGMATDDVDMEEGDFACMHVPGTTMGMEQEEIDAQLARGVPRGCATVTLEDASPAEVSAVYAGAVPGAGFRKAVRLARRGKLSPLELAIAQAAYAPLLSGRSLADPLPTRSRPARKSATSTTRFMPYSPATWTVAPVATSPPVASATLTVSASPAPPGSQPIRPPLRRTPAAPAAPTSRTRGTPMPRMTFAQLAQAWADAGSPAEFDPTQLTVSTEPTGAPPDPSAVMLPATRGYSAAQFPFPPPVAPPAGPLFPGAAGLDLRLSQMEELLHQQQRELADERKQNDHWRQQNLNTQLSVDAEAWVRAKIEQGKLTSAQRSNAIITYVTAARDDYLNPVSIDFQAAGSPGEYRKGTRLEAFKAGVERGPATHTGREVVTSDPTRRDRAAADLSTLAVSEGGPPPVAGMVTAGALNYAAANGLKTDRMTGGR